MKALSFDGMTVAGARDGILDGPGEWDWLGIDGRANDPRRTHDMLLREKARVARRMETIMGGGMPSAVDAAAREMAEADAAIDPNDVRILRMLRIEPAVALLATWLSGDIDSTTIRDAEGDLAVLSFRKRQDDHRLYATFRLAPDVHWSGDGAISTPEISATLANALIGMPVETLIDHPVLHGMGLTITGTNTNGSGWTVVYTSYARGAEITGDDLFGRIGRLSGEERGGRPITEPEDR